MTIRLFILLFIFLPSLSPAQTLEGVIFDNETGEPIDAANVFFANTTYGTLSNPDGTFTLPASIGRFDLIVSHISYRTQKRTITFEKEETKERIFRLASDSKALATITVSAKQGKRWRKDLKKFEKQLFGHTSNAKGCKILNPTVLQFEKKDNKFKAKASDLLQIENKALGYKVNFLLEHFESEGQQVTYAGKPFFEELKPLDKKETKLWLKKRQKAYQGSLPHFLYSLINNDLKKGGFEVHRAILKQNNSFSILGAVHPNDLIDNGRSDSEKLLSFNGFLQVTYKGEQDTRSRDDNTIGNAATRLGHPAEKDMIAQDHSMMKGKTKHQISYLFAKKSTIPIDTSGYPSRPELLVEYGYWSSEGLADLVPFNFQNQNNFYESITNKYNPIYGFQMTNLQIPYDEIIKGGPPKDGIPAIDYPIFVDVNQAKMFLDKNDLILGVEIDGIAKAYPIRILNYHEIVNDWFGDKAIVLTYCPLCSSGAAFSAEVDKQTLNFSVSGLLYNSDVLLYDRQSESLWSQILGKAISGSAASKSLQLITTRHTTFEAWEALHPNTLVLSTQTGFDKDYSKTPYQSYETSNKLLFPVSNESDILDRKSKVIGIEINGRFKAYPFKRLKKSNSPISDVFNGENLIIEYNQSSNSAKIMDSQGRELSTLTMYWFAWFAFHPETEVF